MMPGPRREQLRINDNEIESQTSTKEPQGCQPEHRRNLQVWQLLFLRTWTLQLRGAQLQVAAVPRYGRLGGMLRRLQQSEFYLV